MGYLEQVVARLEASKAAPGGRVAKSPRDALWDILQGQLERDSHEWQNYESASRGGESAFTKARLGAGNVIGRAMDVVSRGLYANTAMMREGVKQGGLPASPLMGAPGFLYNVIQGHGDEIAKAGWEGLSGQRKDTTSDILKDAGWDTNSRSNLLNRVARGAVGFVGDVGLDPITYIPGGAIAASGRVGAKAGFKAVGKELPDILEKGGVKRAFRVKNPVEAADAKSAAETKNAPTPETAASDSLEQTGAAKVNTTVSEKVLANYNKPLPGLENFPDIERVHSVADVTPNAPAHIEGQTVIPLGGMEGRNINAAKRDLAVHRTKAEEVLAPYEGPRYAEDLEIDPYHMTEPGVPKKRKAMIEKERQVQISGTPSQEVKKGISELVHPNTYDKGEKAFMAFDQEGMPFDIGGIGVSISPKKLHDLAIKGGDISAAEAKAHVQLKDGSYVPVHRVVKMLKDRAETAKTIGKQTKTEKYMEEGFEEIPTTRRRKLSPFERLVWEHKAEQKLDPEDVAALRKAGMKSFKQFDEALAQVKAKTVATKYDTLDELAAAVANGTAPKHVVDEMKKRLGKVKLENLIKKIKDAEARVGKHEETLLEREAKKHADERAKIEEKQGLPSPTGSPEVTKDVANILSEAEKTGTAPKQVVRPSVDEWQAAQLADVMKTSVKRQFDIAETHKNRSKGGAWKTDPQYYVGDARWREGFNKRSQMEISQDLIGRVAKRYENLPDAQRASAMYDTVMPMLNAAEQMMREAKITPILGGGRNGRGIPMSMHDILSSLDRDFVEKYFFSKVSKPKEGAKGVKEGELVSWNFAPTQLADIAEQFVHLHLGNKTLPEVEQAVRKIIKEPLEGTARKIPGGVESHLTAKISRKPERFEPIVNSTMNAFTSATPRLGEELKRNVAQTVVDEHRIAVPLTNKAIEDYSAIVNNPTFSPGAHIQAAIDRHKFVDNAAKEQGVPPNHPAVDLAHQAMDAQVADTMPVAQVHAVEKSTADMARATNSAEAAAAQAKLSEAAGHQAAVDIKQSGGNLYDFGRKIEMTQIMGFLTRLVPDMGNEATHAYLLNWNSVAQTYVKDHARVLSKLNKKYSPDEIRSSWNRLQTFKEGDELTPAMQDIQIAIKDMIDVTDGKYGFFTRQVKDPNRLMEDYRRFGVPEEVVLNPDDLENSWKAWKTDDPLDLISRVHAAHTHAVAKQTMGADLTHHFAYDHPAPGRVQIIDRKGTSELAKYIDTTKWYDEDIARQMHMLDDTLLALKHGSKGSTHQSRQFLKNLDIATQMWKAGVTVYRPGHHVRNAVGDIWFNSMDGVTPGYYTKAAKVMATRKGQYQDFDPMRSLAATGHNIKPRKTILTLRRGNEVKHYTADDVYRMMHDSGGLPSFDVIEDVSLSTAAGDPRRATGIVAAMQKAHLPGSAKGKAHKFATGVSEGRDHYIRMAHWLKDIERRGLDKGMSFDDAVRKASFDTTTRVRKFHPDGSDLTPFERQYMRRIIPFYSWVRKAIPLVIETGVAKPGRQMVYPKAMYNWAAAQGIDLEGYGDPFPADQIFPSWISDSTQGPLWGGAGAYAGFKPGIPSADIADDYLANPAQTMKTVFGSMHPFARVPIELMTKTKLRTGGPITDMSDYIDAQVPMGTYIDQLAGGRSLSTGFTQQNNQSPSNVGYEAASMPQGTGFLNWLLGAGITDYSKPSYEKFAQLEQKRAAQG